MSVKYNNKIEGYDGLFTSFLDGGNIYRAWIANASTGDIISLAAIPFVVLLLIITWKLKGRKEYRGD
jgi:PTS system galactitol-specific IIC component